MTILTFPTSLREISTSLLLSISFFLIYILFLPNILRMGLQFSSSIKIIWILSLLTTVSRIVTIKFVFSSWEDRLYFYWSLLFSSKFKFVCFFNRTWCSEFLGIFDSTYKVNIFIDFSFYYFLFKKNYFLLG